MNRSDLPVWARDLAPATTIVVVASIAVSAQVSAADGMLPMLVVVGLLGVCVAVLILNRVDGGMVEPNRVSSLPPPLRPQERAVVATEGDRTAESGVPMPPQPPSPSVRPRPTPRKPVPPSMPTKWSPSAVRALRFEPVAVTVPKLGNTAEENEDAYLYDMSAGRIVVADGASSSFAARDWSRALCTEMVSDPLVLASVAGVAGAATRAAERWKESVGSVSASVAWWAQEGLERGAFATLVVVEVARAGRREGWRAVAVGDSCVIQLRPSDQGWRIVRSFPSEPGEKFGSHPDLIQSSVPDELEGLRWATGELAAGDVLVVATDAVSELGLTEPDPGVLALLAEAGPDELAREFTRRREDAGMVNDDCTLVRVHTTAPLR